MARRTEPMFYDLEIQETKTKKTSKSQVACWWSGDASIRTLNRMCDCQMAGYFNATPSTRRDEQGRTVTSWHNAFMSAQYDYRKSHKCDCATPSKRFHAVRAHLPSGDVIEL